MKQFFDFLPLIVFFIVFKITPKPIDVAGFHFTLGGIYSATQLLIASTILIYGFQYLKYKKLDKNQIITFIAVIVFGGFTLAFHSDVFIKWKAPVINWIFGFVFLFSAYISKKPLIRRMLEHAITMPDSVWKSLNFSWAIFFLALGTANLYVAFNFERYWVDFKVFGSLGLTLLFIIVQMIFIAKHIQPVKKEK
ncbi:MAG: septation protein A [Endozoicomonadaceae bacterium]|nr:septation protein A [Endozoicomonadaceae bacterium]MCY4328481.1 septation protein A [Endozoicomonadaceae bacterium]